MIVRRAGILGAFEPQDKPPPIERTESFNDDFNRSFASSPDPVCDVSIVFLKRNFALCKYDCFGDRGEGFFLGKSVRPSYLGRFDVGEC